MLKGLAKLIRAKNEVDAEIAAIVGRPAQLRNVREFIAATIFDIELEYPSASSAFDGRFRGGSLAGKTANVKWYSKNEGLLDLDPLLHADFYLVFAGPRSAPASTRGETGSWLISSVFLFNAEALLRDAATLGLRVGDATSVPRRAWDLAELYPAQRNQTLLLTNAQRQELSHFGP